MHTAEEVRNYAHTIAFTEREKSMLLSYAALLEAMEELEKRMGDACDTHIVRHCAAEIEKGKR